MSKIFFVASTSVTINSFMKGHIHNILRHHECFVLSNINDPIELSHKNLHLIKINFSRKINILSDLKCFFKYLFYFIKIKPNLIISITPKVGLLSALVNMICLSNKHIHYFTGQHWANNKIIKKIFYKSLDQFILSASLNCLVDGFSQLKYLNNEFWFHKKKLNVLGNGSIKGVDLKIFNESNKFNKEIAKLTNFDNTLKVILYIGRINFEKGLVNLSKAIYKLLNEGEKIALLMVGSVEDDCVDLIKKSFFKFDKNFKILNHTNYPEKFYNYAYLTCLPSEREGFGMSLIESSACGTPVIGSNIYGLKDAFLDNNTGLSFKLNNYLDLAEKIKILLHDNKKYNSLKKNGLQRTQELYNNKIVEDNFSNFIKKFL